MEPERHRHHLPAHVHSYRVDRGERSPLSTAKPVSDRIPAAHSHSNQMHERHGSRDGGVEVGRRDRVDGATGTATEEHREPRQEP